jgi:hypothetical protein
MGVVLISSWSFSQVDLILHQLLSKTHNERTWAKQNEERETMERFFCKEKKHIRSKKIWKNKKEWERKKQNNKKKNKGGEITQELHRKTKKLEELNKKSKWEIIRRFENWNFYLKKLLLLLHKERKGRRKTISRFSARKVCLSFFGTHLLHVLVPQFPMCFNFSSKVMT